ncbi:hypothetical protein DEA8626_00569 [Defluviimonas aquaemixtae]|uniref:Discoidin domain-containing protein n=1 Tax=Albidovulum aquaemixtae TaxID=1542388 RepID=A0A2R8B394_9RHOB|nr:VPLPA-CTERM sorting domain-containing protein [Defluviimonas aquaemixtae]SPH17055.1 hypothetical protein DEA8626_00569 [Defluviimonas aquaemixtae]
MNLKITAATAALFGAMAPHALSAATVLPTSYDMPNGNSGFFTYFDDSYNGSGNPSLSGDQLSGGLGQLTDGTIATQSWNSTAGSHLPYVGWLNVDPVITFNFATNLSFNSMTFYFDDTNGVGGVSQPASVTVNGVNQIVPTNPGSTPFSFTFDLNGATTNTLTASITRQTQWVFLSEVTFDAVPAPIPVPAALPMLLAGLGGLGFMSRYRRKAA